jgi:citrate lyase subunit beta/citryl-CoA lyase
MVQFPQAATAFLFVPAHVEKFRQKACDSAADGVILDLEDAVPPDERPAARDGLAAAIAAVAAAGKVAAVRINRDILDAVADARAALHPGLSLLFLPKSETPGWVDIVAEIVTALERERGLPPGAVGLVPLIESAAGLAAAPAIARCDRVVGLMLGPEDLALSLDGLSNPAGLTGPAGAMVVAARAAGLTPVGSPGSIAEFRDLDAYRAQVTAGRAMGFGAVAAIHPAQLPVIHAIYRPDPAAVAAAEKIVAAAAGARPGAAIAVDGRMVDAPVIAQARRTLARAAGGGGTG